MNVIHTSYNDCSLNTAIHTAMSVLIKNINRTELYIKDELKI